MKKPIIITVSSCFSLYYYLKNPITITNEEDKKIYFRTEISLLMYMKDKIIHNPPTWKINEIKTIHDEYTAFFNLWFEDGGEIWNKNIEFYLMISHFLKAEFSEEFKNKLIESGNKPIEALGDNTIFENGCNYKECCMDCRDCTLKNNKIGQNLLGKTLEKTRKIIQDENNR